MRGVGRYEGDWVNDSQHGYGISTFADGARCVRRGCRGRCVAGLQQQAAAEHESACGRGGCGRGRGCACL